MILPQNADLGVLVLERPTVEEERELGGKGDSYSNNSWVMEAVCLFALSFGEVFDREGDEDERNRAHDEAEGNVADGFEACFAGWEAAWVDSRDSPIGEDECHIAERVEDGVGHSGEEGEGARGDSSVELETGKNNIGNE